MCTSWNGITSRFFHTLNGVKQGGILSPILFCVYFGKLLNRVNGSGIGCHLGQLSFTGIRYADDVALLAPSIEALQQLVNICENFAEEYCVKFNVNKTMCISIGGKGHPPRRNITLYGSPIMWNNSVKHLGNIITSDLSDYDDIRVKKGIFISQVNKLNNKFTFAQCNIKGVLLQPYCCSWYGCQTWDLDSKHVRQINIEWNKAVRRTLNIPRTTHRKLLPLLVQSRSFVDQHRARVSKFIQSFVNSQNCHILLIGKKASLCTNRTMGRNMVNCVVPSGQTEHSSKAIATCIRELLDVRDNISELPGFSHKDVTSLINFMCCN